MWNWAAALPAVRIEVNPLALSRAGIALEDVRTALQSESANRPRGVLDTGNGSFQVYSNQAGRHAADYRDTVIAWRNGAAVRLSDVASVTDGPEDIRTMGLFNGKRAVPIIITRQPGANIVETVDALKAQLPALQPRCRRHQARSAWTAPPPSAPRCTRWKSPC
jgi:multidrug efflux pump